MKLSIKFGEHKIIINGKLNDKYEENDVKEYMKNYAIDIYVDISTGKKITTYTMDLLKNILKSMRLQKLATLEKN